MLVKTWEDDEAAAKEAVGNFHETVDCELCSAGRWMGWFFYFFLKVGKVGEVNGQCPRPHDRLDFGIGSHPCR